MKSGAKYYALDGKRSRAHKMKVERREGEIKLTAGPNWRMVSRNRKGWKMLEKAFANRNAVLRDILWL